MAMVRQALVAAGGKGFRLGLLASHYGNKSLILIEGKPVISFTVEALLKAGVKNIVLSVDGEKNYVKLSSLFKGKRLVRVVQDNGTGESANLPVYFDYLLEKRFFFIYGNAPPLASHLKAMERESDADAVVSLFPFSSAQWPIVAELDGPRVKSIMQERKMFAHEAFVEPPFLLHRDIVPFLSQYGTWFGALRAYAKAGKKIVGVPALMPPSVHLPHEISLLLSHLLKYAGTDYELRIE